MSSPEVVAQRARDGVALLVDQEGSRARLDAFGNGIPLRLEVVEIPLQLFGRAADACGADDGAHAFGDDQLFHGLAHLVAVFAFDPARHATRARVVGHQHQEAAGKADERGEGRALVATFFLLDLHHDFLSFGQHFADATAALGLAVAEEFAGDFLYRQEAVTLGAVIDEHRFERGLDARDPGFIDVGFFLFAGGDIDAEVVQLLTVDHGNAQLFLLSCVDEHSFHEFHSRDIE